MNNKEVIVWLIVQDLKHRRIICGRCQQPVNELHDLSILNIIVKLMGIDQDENKAKVSYELIKLYYSLLGLSGDELKPLAEHIYLLMTGCVALDQKRFEYKKLLLCKTGKRKNSPE